MKLDELTKRLSRPPRPFLETFFREKASDDEVYSIEELCKLLGLNYNGARSCLLQLKKEGKVAAVRASNRTYYGTKKAIKRLREELGWL